MADPNGDDKDNHSPSPDDNGESQHAEPSLNEHQPAGHPYPAGFLYGHFHDPTATGDGSAPTAAFFPFQSALYPYPAPNGMFPINLSQLASAGVFMTRPKRRQVKNACINCSQACKKCDNARPCERCVKYGIGESCVDSARKERKKGMKRGPYKRRMKNGQPIDTSEDVGTDSEWLPPEGGNSPPTTVDPANLPNHPAGHPSPPSAGYVPPDGYYTYPYPYPFPPPGEDGSSHHVVAPNFGPGPHFFPHPSAHPALYPPYPPWGQPPAAFDVNSAGDETNASAAAAGSGGSARTSGKKKKGHHGVNGGEKSSKKSSPGGDDSKGGGHKRSSGKSGRKEGEDKGSKVVVSVSDLEGLDMTDVTDPSLLEDHMGLGDPQSTSG